jgi:resorcinol 4-hydroxylase (FADH2)
VSETKPAPVPSRADLLERVKALAPALRGRAVAAEQARRVSDETAAELRAAGLFRILQPRSFDGFERDYDVFIEVVMELAAACASTAWVFAIAAGQHGLVANFPREAQEEFWADRDAITCGSYLPQGEALPASGGVRLSGKWSFVSGCDIADWAIVGVVMPLSEGPQPCFVLVPRADFTIDDNWHTVGLAATGSKNIRVEDAFVPAHRVLPVARMARVRSEAECLHTNPTYRLPMLCFVPSALGSIVLGAAKGAIADFIALTRARTTRGGLAQGQSPVANYAGVQMRLAEALAASDAARTILLRDIRAALAALESGTLSTEERIAMRRGQAFSVRLALQAVEAVANATGVSGIFADNPIHRALRDALAASRHISLNWDAVATLVGEHALGLEPKGGF